MKQRRTERDTTTPEHIVRIIIHRPSIEHGIPFVARGTAKPWEYPYEEMDVGDSFHVMFSETPNNVIASRIAKYNKNNPNTRFSCRVQITTEGKKLTRIWRTQ
jgi:hypothetical protein